MTRQIPAPALRETAEIWWDSATDPLVVWDEAGRRFELVDAADPSQRLTLVLLAEPPPDPDAVARALAEGLAACDFPPTGSGVPPARAAATLRAAGLDA